MAGATPIPATGQGAGQHPGGPAAPRARWGVRRESKTPGAGSFDPAPEHPGGSIDRLTGETRVVRAREGRRRGVPTRAGRCRLASGTAMGDGSPGAACTPARAMVSQVSLERR
jgi:hypothetical protein